MTTLDRGHRKALDQAVRRARRIAEAGSRQALEHIAVAYHEPRAHLSSDQRLLRNRLRARARQLGDKRDARGAQQIDRLIEQCAYEHWHRMLFARFLAENGLLIEPASSVPISLTDCRELAVEQGKPWIELASEYAVGMLSQVFRLDDPVLELHLPAEHRAELEALLEALPADVFTATDSLGWTYQFWQADAKDSVNAAEVKIGARELAPVTQLFTEDYMVDFLLHNTLGAWWAGKLGPITASSEDEARASAALPPQDGLPALEWQYLRFVAGDDGMWRPAAGTFDGWPKTAQKITVLDPCMGSGHFLVFTLPLLARLRMEEEQLSAVDAVDHVLRENLFGLELDDRCTQIAAFNLALMAWRVGGYRVLPQLNLACSGLSISASENEWISLAGPDPVRVGEMKALYQAFKNAPLLGSLIDPQSIVRGTWADARGGRDQGALFAGGSQSLVSMLARAVERQTRDEAFHELAVTARGVAKAAEILSTQFILVSTNVPYLGRGKQNDELKEYAERHHGRAKADLATCFVERCLAFCAPGASAALVTPNNWLLLGTYKALRERLLTDRKWNVVARVGPRGFETISGEVVNVALLVLTDRHDTDAPAISALDVSEYNTASTKAIALVDNSIVSLDQSAIAAQPNRAIVFESSHGLPRLRQFARTWQGLVTGDSARFIVRFWEVAERGTTWEWLVSAPERTDYYCGRSTLLRWEGGSGVLRNGSTAHNFPPSDALGRRGVLLSQIDRVRSTLYLGEVFNDLSVPLVPLDPHHLPALFAFCSDQGFTDLVRTQTTSLQIRVGYFLGVPVDMPDWTTRAEREYPLGLPEPSSSDPTQWLFDGEIATSAAPAQVAVARLLGFRWPRHSGDSIPGSPTPIVGRFEDHEDRDGIVCLHGLHREPPAATRLREMLNDELAGEWNRNQEQQWFGSGGADSVEDWVRDVYFAEHCSIFAQRPFVFHITDGLVNGFGALVNYHKLAGRDGEGRRTLEKLTHTYLGDWITRQRAAVSANEEGAEARLAAAEHLRDQLLKILEGEPPFDIFVRWKPLHEQPIGWEPDINDGVRVNIRPFMMAKPLNARAMNASILRVTPKIKWDKDRGKDLERSRQHYPWLWGWDGRTVDFEGGREFDGVRWNDLHYTRARKERARREYGETQEAMP
jgi:hypothetical protein